MEIVAKNPINDVKNNPLNTHSNFDLNYPFLQTHRFGDLHPHFVANVVPNDKRFEFRSVSESRSYTLKAPLMQDIYKRKDYFQVDRRAILPIAAPLLEANPTIGDDVDASEVGTSVKNFPYNSKNLLEKLLDVITDVNSLGFSDSERLEAVFYFCFCGEYFYSRGSLLANLGCNLSSLCTITDDTPKYISFDYFVDQVFEVISQFLVSGETFDIMFDNSGVSIRVCDETYTYNAGPTIDLATCFQMMRDSMSFSIVSVSNSFDFSMFTDFIFDFLAPEYPLDIDRLFAYQLVCAHYFTNDKVDYIYSADLYRELLGYYVRGGTPNTYGHDLFNQNGISYRYDWCSAHYVVNMFIRTSGILNAVTPGSGYWPMLRTYYYPYFRAVFGFNRSLRYLDYFTGAKTRPLAVGGTDVQVNANLVSVIDVTQKIQTQRFLNAVNRSGRELSEYVKGIFGVDSPAPDYHNPFWLAHTDDKVFTSEVENTGVAQLTNPNSVTAMFRENSNNYAFSINVDYEGIVIGITYYDIERCYKDYIERTFFHVDRYDRFNPYMQYIGDQPVYLSEFDPRSSLGNYFGYQLRHMEYKQRYAQCAGGFAEYLPGYAFLGNDISGTFLSYDLAHENVNPDFIRSWSFELDPFYLSLANRSLAGYFHFIVKNINLNSADRPMSYAPQIL